jgi:hypothetical protein
MSVWKWFVTRTEIEEVAALYNLLNELWQEERNLASPDELAEHARAWEIENLDFVNDPEYQTYKRAMDRAFGKPPDEEKRTK